MIQNRAVGQNKLLLKDAQKFAESSRHHMLPDHEWVTLNVLDWKLVEKGTLKVDSIQSMCLFRCPRDEEIGQLFRAFWQKIVFFCNDYYTWRRHQMETFSALLALCAGNSPVTGEFPAQRPVTRSFDVFFDLRLNKRLSKQWWGWWFETPSCPLWCHCDDKALRRCAPSIMWCRWPYPWTHHHCMHAFSPNWYMIEAELWFTSTTPSCWLWLYIQVPELLL